MSSQTVRVKVPASTANIGPGFDCLGAALTLSNQFQFTAVETSHAGAQVPQVTIEVSGPEAERVGTDATNLVYQAFVQLYQHLGQTPPSVQIKIELGVPLARGLGSSSTAIVAGLLGANTLAGSPLERSQLLHLAIALEGHPDNVAPALLGGCQLAATGVEPATWSLCEIAWNPEIIPVVAIPNFELSTKMARSVLPQACPYAVAIFNAAHLGLLIQGLQAGRRDWLQAALQDQLHQPYRQRLIPGYEAVQTAALAAGAYGVVISGAGPAVLALSPVFEAQKIAIQMQTAWMQTGIEVQMEVLQVDQQGAIVQEGAV